jgi:glutamine synthetase
LWRESDRNSPTNISWGYNNRTTLLRIPETLPELKRLENRLPSSENNLLQITTSILMDIYDGIIQKIKPQNCTFGLAFDNQYDLKRLKF